MYPVLLITFNRPEHTRRTLAALMVQKPYEMYVYQDGPRDGNIIDKTNCQKVREVIDEITRDSDTIMHKHYSPINRGCRDAVIFAISSVLQDHKAVIVVEDDIITSPAFLNYMTKTLDYYQNRKNVHSISAYSPSPFKFSVPLNYDYDVYASPRLFGWGWGTWRDVWNSVDWSMDYFRDFMKHPSEINAFNRGGDDLSQMLVTEQEGKSSAWDIQFVFDQFKNHMVSIVPCISFTTNIGCDGSGTHCSVCKDNTSDIALLNNNKELKLLDNLYYDREIINRLHSVYSMKTRPLWQKICNWICRKINKPILFQVKSPVYAK